MGKKSNYKLKRVFAPKGYKVLDALKVGGKGVAITFEKLAKAPKYHKRRRGR